MKKINGISVLIGLIIGVFATIIINNYFSPENNFSAFPKEIATNPIDPVEADKLIQAYESKIKDDTCAHKWAINVSKEQYEVIRQTIGSMNSQQLQSISGFRLYFANMPTAQDLVSLTYVIDNGFRQQVPPNGRILVSQPYNVNFSQECPPFCN